MLAEFGTFMVELANKGPSLVKQQFTLSRIVGAALSILRVEACLLLANIRLEQGEHRVLGLLHLQVKKAKADFDSLMADERLNLDPLFDDIFKNQYRPKL